MIYSTRPFTCNDVCRDCFFVSYVYFNMIMAAGILPPQRRKRLLILFHYSQVCEEQRTAFKLEEPGFLIRTEYPRLGASLDSIRTCSCCNPAFMAIKCPFNAKDFDPKTAPF